MIRLFLDVRAMLDKEMTRVYIREEVKEVVAHPKLLGRVIIKAESRFIDNLDVPYEHLSIDDQSVLNRQNNTVGSNLNKNSFLR